MTEQVLNVLGTELIPCSYDPLTGFFRDGCCKTDSQDHGSHVVCARITQEFLDFTLKQGNDLMTPRPEYRFKGLKHGDKWCLCALRWREALAAGVAPPVILESTHQKALEFVTLDQLRSRHSPFIAMPKEHHEIRIAAHARDLREIKSPALRRCATHGSRPDHPVAEVGLCSLAKLLNYG